jgi:predicted nucleic acid-binding protein
MKPISKRIVVDASIARSAGTTQHPVSRSCREFLDSFLKICHRIVMTPEVREEWKKHRSNFSASWLASMTARKKVEVCNPDVDAAMADKLRQAQLTEKDEAAIRKDARLLEAALAADSAVASLDEEVRSLLKGVSKQWVRIKPVVWVNPASPQEEAVSWLSAGAPMEKQRTLGFEPGTEGGR